MAVVYYKAIKHNKYMIILKQKNGGIAVTQSHHELFSQEANHFAL